MTEPRAFVIGDSHTRAISQAIATAPHNLGVHVDVHWIQTVSAGKTRGDMPLEQAAAEIARLAPTDIVVVSLLGTFHNIFGLLQHDKPYWILPPSGAPEEIPPGHTLIPRHVMEDTLTSWCAKNKRIEVLLRECRARRYHLMTPPPKADNRFIGDRTKTYRNREVTEDSLAPATLRLRLWQVEMIALARFCAPLSMQLVAPPPAALTPERFLAPAYYGDDATHANAAYGSLVVAQLAALAKNPSAGQPEGR